MITSEKMAKQIEQVYFGGNCTYSNLFDQLKDVDLKQATKKFESLNTILALTYHIHYYTKAQLKVLKGRPLDGHDSLSFLHPELKTEAEWEAFKENIFNEAKEFVSVLSQLDDKELLNPFANGKYGDNLSNFLCLDEHTHYHLGQIALVKKLTSNES